MKFAMFSRIGNGALSFEIFGMVPCAIIVQERSLIKRIQKRTNMADSVCGHAPAGWR